MTKSNQIIADMEGWLNGHSVPLYREIIDRWGSAFVMYRLKWESGGFTKADTDHDLQLFNLRDECIKRFGFSIPCRELLDMLNTCQPLIEIGAGTGFLTAVARRYGIDIIGTDARKEKGWFEHGTYDPLQLTLPGKTAVRRFNDMNIFCSWPSYNKTWFRQALKAMRIGRKMIVIDEDCCADDTAKIYLRDCFEHEGTVFIPSWPMIHDHVCVYRKVRQTPRK